MRRTLNYLTLASVAIAIVASAHDAGAVGAAKAPKPPLVGRWTMNNNDTAAGVQEIVNGRFRVTKHHRDVVGMALTIGADAETACGTGKVQVKGKQPIHDAKGESIEGGSYNAWIVGKNRSGQDPVFAPIKVTLSRAGKTFKGGLEMNWRKPDGGGKKTPSAGVLSYAGPKAFGGCEIDFGYNRH
jgi:hypothetical protein